MKKDTIKNTAIAVIVIGLVSAAVGGIGKLMGVDVVVLGPRSFAAFAAICFLLSINLLLLSKES